ncbi:hypothetical protein M513_11769 [Trichuris suis]|nr:hypothetical protein M513_11769 [Trichuris suis]
MYRTAVTEDFSKMPAVGVGAEELAIGGNICQFALSGRVSKAFARCRNEGKFHGIDSNCGKGKPKANR